MELDIRRIDRFVRDFAQHLTHVGAAAVNAAQRISHAFFRRDHRHDIELNPPFHVIDRQNVGRVGHGDEKLPVQPRNRHDLVGLGHLARNQSHDLFGDAQSGQIHRRNVEAAPHAESHVLVGDELFVRQNLQEASAFFFLDCDSFLELIRQQKPVFDQDIGDAFRERFTSHVKNAQTRVSRR